MIRLDDKVVVGQIKMSLLDGEELIFVSWQRLLPLGKRLTDVRDRVVEMHQNDPHARVRCISFNSEDFIQILRLTRELLSSRVSASQTRL